MNKDTIISSTKDELSGQSHPVENFHYSSIFKNNHAIMLLIDPYTENILDANPAACSFYGYSYQSMLKLAVSDINTLTKGEIAAEIQLAKSEARNYFYFQHRLSNGVIRDVEVYSGPITLVGKELLFSIIHDMLEEEIAERSMTEEALRKSQSEAEQANIAKSQFLANMSHEIRTPMNGIIGMTDLTLMTELKEEQRAYLTIVKSSTRLLLRVLNDILDYSKIEAGKVNLEQVPFDLRETVCGSRRVP